MNNLEKFMLWMTALYILDVATTMVGLKLGGIEMNPLMTWLQPNLESGLAMMGLKVLSLLGIYLISRNLIRRGSAAGAYRMHTFLVAVMITVVVVNLTSIVGLIF